MKVGLVPGGNYRGVLAEEDISAGELVIAVPAGLCVQLGSADSQGAVRPPSNPHSPKQTFPPTQPPAQPLNEDRQRPARADCSGGRRPRRGSRCYSQPRCGCSWEAPTRGVQCTSQVLSKLFSQHTTALSLLRAQ